MASSDEVEKFLLDFKQKMKVFNIFFRDERGKNKQALADLDIRPLDRVSVLEDLITDDYSEEPLQEQLYDNADMWVFGKTVKDKEVYIKITMGKPGTRVICISFHIAEHSLHYPLKGA